MMKEIALANSMYIIGKGLGFYVSVSTGAIARRWANRTLSRKSERRVNIDDLVINAQTSFIIRNVDKWCALPAAIHSDGGVAAYAVRLSLTV